ncbi:hypothetical protein EC968_007739 [Mortierella alpina]|nr:hypothetical protein EC968_007739 [Mortierella alpina]
MPLPVTFPLSKKSVAILDNGNEDDQKDDLELTPQLVTVRLCLPCRVDHYKVYREPISRDVIGKYLSKAELKEKYSLGSAQLPAIADRRLQGYQQYYVYSEVAVLEHARVLFGGDIGRQALFSTSGVMAMEESNARIENFRRRRLSIMYGREIA